MRSGNGVIKKEKSSNKKRKNAVLHERAKIFRSVYNMVMNRLEIYKRRLHIKGEVIPNAHNNFTIPHETGFPVLRIALVPNKGIPYKFSVFYHPKGTEYSDNLEPESLDQAFEKLL